MTGKAKKPVGRKKANGYKMPAPLPAGEVIVDTVGKRRWRLGPSIGVGGFGEIYSACDDAAPPSTVADYPYVIKIEPHENGPLFVEKHFYMRNASKDDVTKYMKEKKLSSLGMPTYEGSGSHVHGEEKYRYLVLPRYSQDLWSLFTLNKKQFPPHTVFLLGLQMLEVLEYIHSRGYVHADLKGANMLLGRRDQQQAYLLDYGLAARVGDKEWRPQPKCAHNGTIEYTSRDAHLGVATMRGDLEILGYNMLHWLSGSLPWDQELKTPAKVQQMKEDFMADVRASIAKHCPSAPDALYKFFQYIQTLKPKEMPDYGKCKQIFEAFLKSQGKSRSSKLEFGVAATKPKVGRKGKAAKVETVSGKDDLDGSCDTSDSKPVKKAAKRKSLDKVISSKVKKQRTVKTPLPKKNHVNIATQTSVERPRNAPKNVSFESPVSSVMESAKKKPVEASGPGGSGGRGRRRLVAEKEEEVVKTVVRREVCRVKPVAKSSWRDCPTVRNGKAPPAALPV